MIPQDETKGTPGFTPGEWVLAFDASAWLSVGHDVGNNEQFWKRARVLRVYPYPSSGEMVADLHFEGAEKLSTAHFVDFFRPLPARAALAKASHRQEGAGE